MTMGSGAAARVASGTRPESARALLLELLPESRRASVVFAFVGNFECERWWAPPDAVTLPRLQSSTDARIVAAMAAFGLPIFGPDDMVIVADEVDQDVLDYLNELGWAPPRVVCCPPGAGGAWAPLDRPAAMDAIRAFRSSRPDAEVHLVAHGNTTREEAFARQAGLSLVGATAATCAEVNSKIYSRRLSRVLGLETVPGAECESVEDLRAAYASLAPHHEGRRLLLKEAFGVSGKGLIDVTDPAQFAAVLAQIERRARAGGRVAFVLERWVDARLELNYQFLVPPGGPARLLTVKESMTAEGAHLGHRWPAALAPSEEARLQEAVALVGEALAARGFVGIAGADAIAAADGTLYPILEINARFNMSTYELPLDAIREHGQQMAVKSHALQLRGPMSFARLHARLGPDLFGVNGAREGIGILHFGVVNGDARQSAGSGARPPARGRVTAFYVARTRDGLSAYEKRLLAAIEDCGGRVRAA